MNMKVNYKIAVIIHAPTKFLLHRALRQLCIPTSYRKPIISDHVNFLMPIYANKNNVKVAEHLVFSIIT